MTGVEIGKKIKTQTMSRNNTAPMLTKTPKRPRFQRRGGSGSPRKRRTMRQVKDIMYVASNAETARDPMALKATVEPILIKDSRQVIVKVIRTALSGIFQPGLTYGRVVSVLQVVPREIAYV